MSIARQEAITLVKDTLGLTLHPAGIHSWDAKTQKKQIVKLGLKFNQEWKDEYTTGKIDLLGTNYIVLDIDGDPSFKFNRDDNTISFSINTHQYTLPMTAYTQTSLPGKYHFYYRLPEETTEVPSRLTNLVNEDIDVFTHGTIFEWHSFSPHNEFHFDHDIVDAPIEWVNDMAQLSPMSAYGASLTVVPSHARANIVKDFLDADTITFKGRGSQKHMNTFFKMVFPRDTLPRTKDDRKALLKSIKWEHFKISHDLINKIAVKLTTTAQLDTYEHVYPALHKIVEALTGDSYKKEYTDKWLTSNILCNLPHHDAITTYDDDEVNTLEEALHKQTGRVKLVRTVVNSDIKYVRIDAITLKPILSEGVSSGIGKRNIYINRRIAETLHTEFLAPDDAGKMFWDDSLLPWVTIINDIYASRSFIDEDNNYNIVLNTYEPTRYYQEAIPHPDKPDNVYTRAIAATIGIHGILIDRTTKKPIDATDFYHHYMARTMFGATPPKIKLWMAALETKEGGAGKSLAGIEFPSKVMGNTVVQQTKENISKGWGDNVVNARLVSLEDLEKMSPFEFNALYGVIKRLGGNSFMRLNMKGNQYIDAKIKLGMTMSSNWRPPLPNADRWIVALEPAWLHGYMDKLNIEDIYDIGRRMGTDEYDEEAQDIVNYWYHLFINEPSKYNEALETFAPISIYRKLWVRDGANPTKAIVPALTEPDMLLSLIKEDVLGNPSDYIRFLLANYSEQTGKVALPWMWFHNFIPFVIKDEYADSKTSRAGVSKMLAIDFSNPGSLYVKWKEPSWVMKAGLPAGFTDGWAGDSYLFSITQEAIGEYKQYLVKDIQVDDGLEPEL